MVMYIVLYSTIIRHCHIRPYVKPFLWIQCYVVDFKHKTCTLTHGKGPDIQKVFCHTIANGCPNHSFTDLDCPSYTSVADAWGSGFVPGWLWASPWFVFTWWPRAMDSPTCHLVPSPSPHWPWHSVPKLRFQQLSHTHKQIHVHTSVRFYSLPFFKLSNKQLCRCFVATIDSHLTNAQIKWWFLFQSLFTSLHQSNKQFGERTFIIIMGILVVSVSKQSQ